MIDILAIGDITTDAFIKLQDAEVHCDIDKENCKLCVRFGDKIPFESATIVRAVGNSSNAAVSAARLGLNSSLLSYMGDDHNGKECLEELKKNNVDTKYIRVEKGKHTNYHYVLWYEIDRTILIKHEVFDYDLGDIQAPKWIYCSSLGDNSLKIHGQIAEFLEKNPETRLAFQPGTFQLKLGAEALKKIYAKTDVFFCNLEEAKLTLKSESHDVLTLMKDLSALGPKIVVVTDSVRGAHAFDSANGKSWFIPMYPHVPYESTGAGDAFASTVISALASGLPIEKALLWAPINAMSVVQKIGAQEGLLSREKLEDYLAKAPGDYKLKEILV